MTITTARAIRLKFNETKIENLKSESISHVAFQRRDDKLMVFVDAAEPNKNGVLIHKNDRFAMSKDELSALIASLQQMQADWE